MHNTHAHTYTGAHTHNTLNNTHAHTYTGAHTHSHTQVMEEDAQPLETPIIAPVKVKKIETLEREPLKTRFTNEFLATLMANPGKQ